MGTCYMWLHPARFCGTSDRKVFSEVTQGSDLLPLLVSVIHRDLPDLTGQALRTEEEAHGCAPSGRRVAEVTRQHPGGQHEGRE